MIVQFPRAVEHEPNTISVYDATSFALLRSHSVYTFDLRQHKTSLDDWTTAFELAVAKRARDLNYEFFIGLSAGHDRCV